jgi:hypothetical protein
VPLNWFKPRFKVLAVLARKTWIMDELLYAEYLDILGYLPQENSFLEIYVFKVS